MKGWKRELRKQIAAEQRRAAREQLTSLREQIRHAKADRKAAVCRAKNQCKVDRLAVRAKIKERRARVLAELAELGARERNAARETCALEIGTARALSSRVKRARGELQAERKYRAELRRIAAANKREMATHRRATRAERRSESDDEVRANIPDTYVRLWERVKRGIKTNPRASRTEVFMQYAEEHPEELLESIDDATDRLVRELEARERAASRAMRQPRAAASSLDAPF